MEAIRTTYTPQKGGIEITQYWHAYLDEYFSPSAHRIESVARELGRWVARVNATTQRSSSIRFVPVNVADIPEGWNRTIICGFVEKGVPTDPIVMRGKPLPELEAEPFYLPHEDALRVRFRSTDFHCALSAKQSEMLAEWFEAQLRETLTLARVKSLQRLCLDRSKKAVEEFLASMREKCDSIAGAGKKI